MPSRKRPASSVDFPSQPLVSEASVAASPPAASVDASSPVRSWALSAGGASAAPEPLVTETSMAASPPAAASVGASSPVRSLALSAGGASAAPEPLVTEASMAASPPAAASAGGGVASPPVGSPGRNKALFMQSVTPQAMTCNLSMLSILDY